MTRTKPLQLLLLAVLGGGITWLLETGLTAGGRPIILPPFTLAVALVLIAVIILVMARPVRQVSRGLAKRIDPFYATRVLMLAKASSLSGALVGGGGFGIAAFLLSRSVGPAVGSVTMAFATAVAGVLLVAAGLIAEHWCFIPPEDDSNAPTPATRDAR